MDDTPYHELDPGIREVVRWLRRAGYATCDSGDGVSKFKHGYSGPDGVVITDPAVLEECGVINEPHVIMHIPKGSLAMECDRLMAALHGLGIDVVALGPECAVTLQGSYDPANGISVIALFGLDDATLLGALAAGEA